MVAFRLGCDVCSFPVIADQENLGTNHKCLVCKSEFELRKELTLPPENPEDELNVTAPNLFVSVRNYSLFAFWVITTFGALGWMISHFFYSPQEAAKKYAGMISKSNTQANNPVKHPSSYTPNVNPAFNTPRNMQSNNFQSINPRNRNIAIPQGNPFHNGTPGKESYNSAGNGNDLAKRMAEDHQKHMSEMQNHQNQIMQQNQENMRRMTEQHKSVLEGMPKIPPPVIPRRP